MFNSDSYAEKIKVQQDLEHENVRYRRAQADIVELKLQRNAAKVIDVDFVQFAINQMLVSIKTALLSVPQRTAMEAANSNDPVFVEELIDKEIRAAIAMAGDDLYPQLISEFIEKLDKEKIYDKRV